MKILLTALAALIVAAPAAAAPPPNDNRADAQQLPTFPSSVHGSTVEATAERLDPQVSKCGRVDATVWYRIDAAPDGTIVATTQASGQFAPVVRLYRRLQSSIQEVSCSTAKAGGKAVASVAAVRGAGYLILVGRRPGASGGEFDLRADLVLPPDNDERGEAARVNRLPATVRGTTLGATSDDYRDCGMGGGVWYRFKGPATGRALVQLDTGERNGAVAVFRRSGRSVEPLGCAPTDRRGSLIAGFAAKPGADYLILVGDRAGSSPGAFVLRIRAGEAPEHLPGRALPHGGARGSVDGLSDVNDVWSVRMRSGRTYRIAFASSPCAQLSIRRASKTLRRFSCRGYTSFTPGPDGGGRYAVEVRASGYSGRQRYRLQVVPAGADDIGVGLDLAAGSIHRGSLSPSGVDVLDLYHFEVARLSEVRLDLARGAGRSFSLVLLTDTGQRIATGETGVRRRLGRGRYVVAVEAPPGTEAGRYRLALRLRDVTATIVLVSGSRSAEVMPGSTVSISCSVSPATTGGRIELQIDRFDPLSGWHFHRSIRLAAGSALSWRPPAAGRWRVRARFLGTRGSAPSRSGYAQIVVARPIG
jgi:hypothetical protein